MAYPTAALLRSLQWGSEGRSRGAEHRGRREVCLYPQRRCFAACSGFQTVGPATRNLGGDGRFAMPHSGAASQLAVGFRWSVPLRGTCGEMGGLLSPTAALLRSLQWVSDSRSRVAEPMGRWGIARPTAALLRSLQWVSDSRSRVAEPMGRREVCYTPQRRCFAACSGFQMVGPASRNLWGDGGLLCPTAALLRSLQWGSDGRSRGAEHRGRWEVCLYPQRRCFAACSGFRIVGPALRNLWGDGRFAKPHSGAASQLAVGFRWSVPLCGT